MPKLNVGVLDLPKVYFYALALLIMYTYVSFMLFVMLFGLMGFPILWYYIPYMRRVCLSVLILLCGKTMGVVGIENCHFIDIQFDNG